jgi:hypothetical protein
MKTIGNDPAPSDPYSLNQIKGLDQPRQQQLQELLDITTLRSLAIASAAAIADALRETEDSITEATVAGWIAEAQQIVSSVTQQQDNANAEPSEKAVAAASADHSEERKMAETEGDSPPTDPEEWQTKASILLELQVPVGEDESVHRWRLLNPCSDSPDSSRILSDQATHSLRNWLQQVGHALFHPDDNPLQDWLLHQIPEVIPPASAAETKEPEEPEEPEEPSPVVPKQPVSELSKSLTVQVYEVLLLQPPTTTMPIVAIGENIGFPGPLQANQLFQVRVDLVLPELAEWPLPAGASYSLEVFAKSVGHHNKPISIGKSRACELVSGQTQYKTEIGAATLPSGLYRLEVSVTFQGLDIPLIIHKISRLQVI